MADSGQKQIIVYAWLEIAGLLSFCSILWSGDWLPRFASSPEFATLPQPLTSMCRWRDISIREFGLDRVYGLTLRASFREKLLSQ